MKLKNKVLFLIEQVVPASITGEGKYKEDLVITHSFESETTSEITNHNLGMWIYANVLKYMHLQKAQGEETFRQNRYCNVTIKVNSKEESVKMKFYTNLDKIVKGLEKYPELIGKLFTPVPSIGSITAKSVIDIANGNKVVIAKRVESKNLETIHLPAVERLSLDNVELTEKDIAQLG